MPPFSHVFDCLCNILLALIDRMDINVHIVPPPKFSLRLLSPQYWLVWFGFGLLAFIVNILPYKHLRCLGTNLGLFAQKLLNKRQRVAMQNLQLCFPNFSEEQYHNIVRKNFQYSGMALIEMGMAWFWPEWRLRRISSNVGQERIEEQEENGRGVLVICSHHFNLELTACIFSQFAPGYGVYRPHTNPVYEFIQHRSRTRFGHKMVDRRDVKSMLKVLKKGHRLWYLPDHDYGHKNSVFVPFFAVDKAATTAGSSVLIDATRCAVISGVTVYDNHHYTLHVGEDISHQVKRRNPEQTAMVLNSELEKMIERDIPAWMWLHKRFKSRPEGEESL